MANKTTQYLKDSQIARLVGITKNSAPLLEIKATEIHNNLNSKRSSGTEFISSKRSN